MALDGQEESQFNKTRESKHEQRIESVDIQSVDDYFLILEGLCIFSCSKLELLTNNIKKCSE